MLLLLRYIHRGLLTTPFLSWQLKLTFNVTFSKILNFLFFGFFCFFSRLVKSTTIWVSIRMSTIRFYCKVWVGIFILLLSTSILPILIKWPTLQIQLTTHAPLSLFAVAVAVIVSSLKLMFPYFLKIFLSEKSWEIIFVREREREEEVRGFRKPLGVLSLPPFAHDWLTYGKKQKKPKKRNFKILEKVTLKVSFNCHEKKE